ncbi:FadR/GntR family transcriptional regulator [Gemmobacter sp.]|uniref:FadR/GntR family transcriptional regulator n=1 Tax=Gemmobacter sp. TaxID=1898957 RepID=UPI002AFE9ACA|nr:FCD domain-containing protein [Gemmobacter sp.]
MTGVARSKAEYVAQRLLDRIVTQNLQPGSPLGTEAEILQQFDVSRPTFRESLRILEAQGVLELRPGPKGGIIVAMPGTDILAHGLSVHLRMHDIPFVAVLRARSVMEPALAAEAAEHGNSTEFEELQRCVARMGRATSAEDFLDDCRSFHAQIAQASHNLVMTIFASTVSIIAAAEMSGIDLPAPVRSRFMAEYQAIVDACRQRDSERAARKMKDLVCEFETMVQKRNQHNPERATMIVEREGRRLG